MKKILSLMIAFLMVMSLVSVAFADGEASPSNSGGPSVVNKTEEAPFIITWYRNRSRLSKELQAEFEEAYGKVEDALKEVANGANVAISDVFNVRETHPGRATFPANLKVKAEGLDHFAGLGYYDNGAWKQIPAEVNGNYLSFSISNVGDYAIAEYVQD